jgi:hypothetical protein
LGVEKKIQCGRPPRGVFFCTTVFLLEKLVESIVLFMRMKKAFGSDAVRGFVPEIFSPKVENSRKFPKIGVL